MDTIKLSEEELERAMKATQIIRQNLQIHFTVIELAKKVKLSSPKLKLAFRTLYGVGVYEYLQLQRMEKAKTLLLEGKALNDIYMEIGYTSKSNFCKAFRKLNRISPEAWKKNHSLNAV